MRVLLTNDDGIHAAGLKALYQELKSDFEVHIVAPDSEMSAVGHAITLTSPLRVQEVYRNGNFFGYGVKGTPADCVKIAVQELLETAPDVILSGINLGANVGVNVLYSGTVSAATEGAFLGIPSAAVSLDTRTHPDFVLPPGSAERSSALSGKRLEAKNGPEREHPAFPGKDMRRLFYRAGRREIQGEV